MEINKLKELAEAENGQAQKYRDMYEAVKDEVKRSKLESLGYKIISFGSILAIVAIAL